MRLPKVRELIEAIKSLVLRPYTRNFLKKPTITPVGFRGKPQFYEEDCVGCNACAEVCPAKAIDVEDDLVNKTRTLTHHQDVCVYCQSCERACITGKGIKLTREYDLATYDRSTAITGSKKELVVCENCGKAVGALDHIKFLANKVGHLLYTNPTLLLAKHKELKLLNDMPNDSKHKRSGHLRILCPNCRREMILKEQW
jgi:formate hydrogenlyase subunit 6/NADH:ubiquinone oxidoreductase subunit I